MAVLKPPTSNQTNRREFIARCTAGAATLTAWPGVPNLTAASGSASVNKNLSFRADGDRFPFDTGPLKGVLHPKGRSIGLSAVVDVPTGTTISRSVGLFAHYRLLEPDTRYGHAAWDWSNTSRLLPSGAVESLWRADDQHPFDLKAVYRWTNPDTLDLVTTVTAQTDLSKFEVFLASYFNGFGEAWGYVEAPEKSKKEGRFVEATRDRGTWQMFPRDEAAVQLIQDGRWQHPPSPVQWAIRPRLAGPLGLRRDRETGLAGLVMAPPEDCFAVATPYGQQGHRSLYLSLLGQDIQRGQTVSARSRLVVRRRVSFEDAARIYKSYVQECRRSGREAGSV